KGMLGVFTILIALWGLYSLRRDKASAPSTPLRSAALKAALFAGGIIHGAFGCGGPLIVLYASRAMTEKRSFRATMCLNWTALNAIHLIRYTVNGEWTANTGILILYMLPALALSALLGNKIVGWLSGKGYMKAVYLVLLGSGILMLP
ncbi:MAG TPA: TSUP family transporter, partial [Clostridia bacterium]|nr:TSUP family transporter [Clostridia bacterium]